MNSVSAPLKYLTDLYHLASLPSLEQDAGYGVLFLFGLLASVHCLGMCGGLLLTQAVGKIDVVSSDKAKTPLLKSGLYNAGRVFSYAVTGALAGSLGQAMGFSGALRGLIPIASGVFMLLMALNMLEIFPFLRKLVLPVPKGLAKWLYKNAGRNGRPLLVGLLTGLMPCGPLQIAQIYALSTKSAAAGSLSMFIFALGTVPAMFLFGAFSGMLVHRFSRAAAKISAAVVVVMGLIMIGRGLALSGVMLPAMPRAYESGSDFAVAAVEGGVQYVTTEFGAYDYPPIQVKAGIPVEWTILVSERNYNSCNNAIELPAFGLKADLAVGKTRVNFTPKKEGDFIYTCWMGMIKSVIRVTTR